MAPAALQPDAWLSEMFGYPAYRAAADAAADAFAGLGPAFCYARVPTDDVAQVARLAHAGLHVVDVSVQLERTAAPLPETPGAVVPFEPAHTEAVLAIASGSFRYSRFHLDPHIPPVLANRIKQEWVHNYMRGVRGDGLWVALVDGEPAGFLAALVTAEASIIDLVAVAPQQQGRGVGRALVADFVTRYGARAPRLRVGTQIANVASLRLYQRCGFHIASSAYVLHGHFGAGA